MSDIKGEKFRATNALTEVEALGRATSDPNLLCLSSDTKSIILAGEKYGAGEKKTIAGREVTVYAGGAIIDLGTVDKSGTAETFATDGNIWLSSVVKLIFYSTTAGVSGLIINSWSPSGNQYKCLQWLILGQSTYVRSIYKKADGTGTIHSWEQTNVHQIAGTWDADNHQIVFRLQDYEQNGTSGGLLNADGNIRYSYVTIPEATTSAAGLLSVDDKQTLEENFSSLQSVTQSDGSIKVTFYDVKGVSRGSFDIPVSDVDVTGLLSKADYNKLGDLDNDDVTSLSKIDGEATSDGYSISFNNQYDNNPKEVIIPYVSTQNPGVMSSADKSKLDDIEFDEELDENSTHGVQNKAVYAQFSEFQSTYVSGISLGSTTEKAVSLNVVKGNGTTSKIEIPAVSIGTLTLSGTTGAHAGLMTVSDKETLNTALQGLAFSVTQSNVTITGSRTVGTDVSITIPVANNTNAGLVPAGYVSTIDTSLSEVSKVDNTDGSITVQGTNNSNTTTAQFTIPVANASTTGLMTKTAYSNLDTAYKGRITKAAFVTSTNRTEGLTLQLTTQGGTTLKSGAIPTASANQDGLMNSEVYADLYTTGTFPTHPCKVGTGLNVTISTSGGIYLSDAKNLTVYNGSFASGQCCLVKVADTAYTTNYYFLVGKVDSTYYSNDNSDTFSNLTEGDILLIADSSNSKIQKPFIVVYAFSDGASDKTPCILRAL